MYKVKPKAKYGNKKIFIDNEEFDSVYEYERWCELRLLERAGKITNLRRQVPFELIPTLHDADGKTYRKTVYWADFVYVENGNSIVEDAKSTITAKNPVYILKKKLMLWRYEITIRESVKSSRTTFKRAN